MTVAKPLVKTLVTVNSVRTANGKVMSASQGAPAPSVQSVRIAEKLGNVAVSGQRAMQSMQKR